MSACKHDMRRVLSIRVAKIVPKATSGAVNSGLTEKAVLRLPSPRLQALVAFVLPVDTTQSNPLLWCDAANAATFSIPPASWQIFPFFEPDPRNQPNSAGVTEALQTTYGYGQAILPAETSDGYRCMADYHSAGKTARWLDGYTIGGESLGRWLIWGNLVTFNDVPWIGYASLQVEITPAPGVNMSPEEWKHLSELCDLHSLTSSDGAPPLLKCAAP